MHEEDNRRIPPPASVATADKIWSGGNIINYRPRVPGAQLNSMQLQTTLKNIIAELAAARKPEAPRAVVNFYPTKEEAASLKHIYLDDCSTVDSKYFLVSKTDGSSAVLKMSEGEPPMKKLISRRRPRRVVR